MSSQNIKSDFAILDVKAGRGGLRKALKQGKRVSVVIRAVIDGEHSRDDGVSQEFSLDVRSLKATSA